MEDVTREVPAIYPDGIALPAGTCSPEEKKVGKWFSLEVGAGGDPFGEKSGGRWAGCHQAAHREWLRGLPAVL